ncbi:uncharacterized protein METZ01_LOCUS429543, partial [marine metagenome]
VGPLTVAERSVFGAERVKWEVGMFIRAEGGGRMAQPGGGGQLLQSSNWSGSDGSNTKSGTGSASV